jgi:triphosphoribosyl-dephospho-CoA synthase
MALAAGRDQIARQYVSGFATVLAMADRLRQLLHRGAAREDAVTAVFIGQLAAEPDTHICRKHGADSAGEVLRQVAELVAAMPDPPRWSAAEIRQMVDVHRDFLVRQINPGTTADLTVAAVFATELDAMQNF